MTVEQSMSSRTKSFVVPCTSRLGRPFQWLALAIAISGLTGLPESSAAGQITLSQLRVEVRDQADGPLIPARIYLMDDKGAHWAADGLITYVKGREHHFVSPGSFQIKLPAGKYTLRVERGPEYVPWSSLIQMEENKDQKENILLHRWIRMNQLGWYSGDLHNHRPAEQMPALLLSEDLNLAPTLADWIWEDHPVSQPPKTSDAIRKVDGSHVYSVLDKEVERLENGPGAVDLLGLKSPISFQGYRLYPPNDTYCRAVHAQGGYVDAEKILWRDAAALAALQQIDFAGIVYNHFNPHGVDSETEKWGMIPKDRAEFNTIAGMPLWAMEVYYRFLNCGFHLPVSAGSASAVKEAPLGYNRVYVKLDRPFSYANWFQALKSGHSFATNGPMLFLTVNGVEPGHTLRLSRPQPSRLRIHAEASSSEGLDRLEILFKGRLIKSVSNPEPSQKLLADFESLASETGWVVARCFEKPGATIRFAHTSPVYIQFGQESGIVAADARFFIEWIDREIRFYQEQRGFRKDSDRSEMLSFFQKARAVYVKISEGEGKPAKSQDKARAERRR
jgi:hypothetical protein